MTHQPSTEPKHAAGKTLAALRSDFVVVGKNSVTAWQAWVVIGIAAGVAAGFTLVANRSGEILPGFAATTATTTSVISGTTVDSKNGSPLQGIDTQLYIFIAASNTWQNLGKDYTDASGVFKYVGTFQGGIYLLEAESPTGGYRLTWKQFTYSGGDMDIGAVPLSQMSIRFGNFTWSVIPSTGGPYTWSYNLMNQTSIWQRVRIRSLMWNAPAIGSTNTSFQVRSEIVSLPANGSKKFTDTVTIPAGIPDWLYPFCVGFFVTAPDDPFDVITWNSHCQHKGDTTP